LSKKPVSPRRPKIISGAKDNSKLIFPKWLLAAILYGISWCMFFGLNLSFFAWFAFVPLFLELEKRDTFWAFYSRALFFSVVAYVIICHGFLFTPRDQLLILIATIDELVMASISFALLYPFKKIFGFRKALIIFPFLISLWEWTYQKFEHTFGYLMLSHSQCQNTWLIQYIDIFGVWSIACWVMLFNVLIYFQYKRFENNFRSPVFRKNVAIIFIAMLIPPLCYYTFRYSQINKDPAEFINVTLVNTNFSVFDNTLERASKKIERLVFITDSIDYELKQRGLKSDLYVWHEGAIDYGNQIIFTGFVDTAVNDWDTPLLTGMGIIPQNATKDDRRFVNRAVLITPGSTLKSDLQYYDKIRLSPGHEMIPYHKLLVKIPFFPVSLTNPNFLKSGSAVKLINLKIRNGKTVKIGTPICQEQNYPEIWNGMALKGAEFFVQLSFESWWPIKYFQEQMAGITRLRCIETRRSTARCSNGGLTCFINAFGEIYATSDKTDGTITADIDLHTENTLFLQYQSLFPILSIVVIFFFSVWELHNIFIKNKS